VNKLTSSSFLTGANANGANDCNNIDAATTNVGCQGTNADVFGAEALGTSARYFIKLDYSTDLFYQPAGITPLAGSGASPNRGAGGPAKVTDPAPRGGAGGPFRRATDGISTNVPTLPVGTFAVDKVRTKPTETYGLSGITTSGAIEFVSGTQSNPTDAGSFTAQSFDFAAISIDSSPYANDYLSQIVIADPKYCASVNRPGMFPDAGLSQSRLAISAVAVNPMFDSGSPNQPAVAPEPTTMLLLGVGLSGLLIRGRCNLA
jgi:hypothetical protein